MPNWVSTYINFDGDIESINKVFNEIGNPKSEQEEQKIFDFNKLVPMPESLKVEDWYDWCCRFWGTKWNSCSVSRSENTLYFQTAWSWPEPIMYKLAEVCKKYGVGFEGKWADEDCGSNDGEFYFEGSSESELDYDYYESCSSDACKAYIDCWGETDCIGTDKDGNYFHYECGKDGCPNYCMED